MEPLVNAKLYENIRITVAEAQKKVYTTVNFVMVETYWKIGRQIYQAQGENDRAEYGSGLLKELSAKLTAEFGKGFTLTNLKYMRLFYIAFPNRHALRDQLSWTHYRLLLKVENEKAREFYLDECANPVGALGNWNVKSILFTIKGYYLARIWIVSERKFKDLNQGWIARISSEIPMCWNFWDLHKPPTSTKKI